MASNAALLPLVSRATMACWCSLQLFLFPASTTCFCSLPAFVAFATCRLLMLDTVMLLHLPLRAAPSCCRLWLSPAAAWFYSLPSLFTLRRRRLLLIATATCCCSLPLAAADYPCLYQQLEVPHCHRLVLAFATTFCSSLPLNDYPLFRCLVLLADITFFCSLPTNLASRWR